MQDIWKAWTYGCAMPFVASAPMESFDELAARNWSGSHSANLWVSKLYGSTSEDLSLQGRYGVAASLAAFRAATRVRRHTC